MAVRLGFGDNYILDINTRDALLFKSPSEDVSDSASPNYSDVDIIGRSSPLKAYNSTGPRTIDLTLSFAVSLHQNDLSSNDDRIAHSNLMYEQATGLTAGQDLYNSTSFNQTALDALDSEVGRVVRYVAFLRSLVYPDYNGQLMNPPPKVLLSLGSFIKAICVVTSADVTWKKPWTTSGIPMLADVSLSFQSITDQPFSSQQIRNSLDTREAFTAVFGSL